jgi:hypothetical protein
MIPAWLLKQKKRIILDAKNRSKDSKLSGVKSPDYQLSLL